MKLKSLSIELNDSDYADYDGTPPHQYKGNIVVDTRLGSVTTLLTQEDITDIVRVVAGRVTANMREVAMTVEEDVRNAVQGNLLTHVGDCDD